ncbi:TPA: transferase [Vibrio vulnificus]|nr:transferase [Vibrio vulnificus]
MRYLIVKKLVAKYRKLASGIYRRKFLFYTLFREGQTEVLGDISISQSVKILGKGRVSIADGVCLGYATSPQLRHSEIYIEARGEESTIEIGRNVMINNSSAVIADKSSIHIGDETLIGPGFMCLGSNFHPLSPDKRKTSDYTCKPIIIGRNVFIGANVTILQGVEIGDNSVIGAGCVISRSVEKNKIVRVNPPTIEALNIDE